MSPGPKLDAAVASLIENKPKVPKGWDPLNYIGDPMGTYSPKKMWMLTSDYETRDVPYWEAIHLSTDITSAFVVVDYISPLVCLFQNCDGYFHLDRGDWADLHINCTLKHSKQWELDSDPTSNKEDPESWAAHFHIGAPGEKSPVPKHWKIGDKFCAYGSTAPHAIALATLKALKK